MSAPVDDPIIPIEESVIPCQLMRSKSRGVYVIRMCSTGVILEIELDEPLDITRSCMVCATKPVDAVVRLGPWEGGMHRRCSLWVAWPTPLGGMPDPVRYVRKRFNPHLKRAPAIVRPPAKRQKTDTEEAAGE